MVKDRRIINLRFTGDRYTDAALDESAMLVVIRFQKALRSLAKTLHKSTHSESENSLDERLRLVVRTINPGSTNISLEAAKIPGELDLNQVPNELYSATDLVYRTYSSAVQNEVLPAEMPVDFIPQIARLADDLQEGSSISFSPPLLTPVEISQHTRSSLLNWVETSYTDTIEVSGEVVQADVKNKTCRLFDPLSKRIVFIRFDDLDEETVTHALHQHDLKRLIVGGTGEFNSKGHLLRFQQYSSMEMVDNEITELHANLETFSEIASRIVADIPDDLWDKLPRDATTKHNEII